MTRMEEIDHLIYGLEVRPVDREFMGYVQFVQSKQREEIIAIEIDVNNYLCSSIRKELLSVIKLLENTDMVLARFTETHVLKNRDEVTDILTGILKVMKELEDSIQKYKNGTEKDFPLSGYLYMFKLKLDLIKYHMDDFLELLVGLA